MYILQTIDYSQKINVKLFRESLVLHISYTRTLCLKFFILHPIHNLGKLHDLCYFMIAHTQPFFMYQPTYYLKRIKITICQKSLKYDP